MYVHMNKSMHMYIHIYIINVSGRTHTNTRVYVPTFIHLHTQRYGISTITKT